MAAMIRMRNAKPVMVWPVCRKKSRPAPGPDGWFWRNARSVRRVHGHRVQDDFLLFRAAGVAERHHAALGEVAAGAHGVFRHVLFEELLEARDHATVGVLDVEEQRTRDRVVTG